MKEENLIFIISQPRSGSTYLQNLLSNNAQVNTCSEPWLLLNYLNQLKPDLVRTNTDNYLGTHALKDYLENNPKLNYKRNFKNYVLSVYSPLAENYKFVIDKTPRYWEILDEIIELFPKSKIIILHRNPIHVLKSIIKTWNLQSYKALNLFRRDLIYAPKTLLKFSTAHKENKNVYSLTYKNLIENTDLEINKLYDWLGILYTKAVLSTEKNQKYKGNYGDPFQNANGNYQDAKNAAKNRAIPKKFRDIIQGYAYFLGTEFLDNYKPAGKDLNFKIKKTMAFKYLLHLGEDEQRSFGKNKDFKWFLKTQIYKLWFGE